MRKWQNLAAPDDPNSWYDVYGVWPTPDGAYETCAPYGTFNQNLVAGTQAYAFAGKTLTGTREFVVTANKILEYSGGALTDRTNGVSIGSYPMMAQYGSVTICVMGNATATVFSTATTFSALSGAPKGEIVLVCSGAVVVLNTDTSSDGWATSDVFDYTNWTTNEAANGRLLDTPGPILAGCVFGNAVYAFKSNGIYRGQYVGGVVKWAWSLVWNGAGISVGSGFTANQAKHYVCAGLDCMLFMGQRDQAGFTDSGSKTAGSYAYLFDGTSAPRIVNPLTTIIEGAVLHDPSVDMFTVIPLEVSTNRAFYYSKKVDAWGYSGTPMTVVASTNPPRPVMGSYEARGTGSPQPTMYTDSGGNVNRYTRGGATTDAATIAYVETTKIGLVNRKTRFSRITPILRRYIGGQNGVGTAFPTTLSISFFRERYSTSTSSTATGSLSSDRNRFDFQGADNFARFKYSFQYWNIEIDDLTPESADSGSN